VAATETHHYDFNASSIPHEVRWPQLFRSAKSDAKSCRSDGMRDRDCGDRVNRMREVSLAMMLVKAHPSSKQHISQAMSGGRGSDGSRLYDWG
jgi:hypothetical protein